MLAMSALGHKRRFALQQVMSALPPKADIIVRRDKLRRHCQVPSRGQACGVEYSFLLPCYLVLVGRERLPLTVQEASLLRPWPIIKNA
jgi:hypothetical protein